MGERIKWADYYKALAIVLVVIGHSTGKFNGYIYQFHVASFFFISGYLSKICEKKLDDIVIMKFFSLLLPYLFYGICGLSLFDALQRMGILRYVSSWETIPTWFDNVKNIFDGLYCDWLGASWFLVSLFAAVIISKICVLLCGNKISLSFFLLSLFLYRMGYFYHQSGTNPTFFNNMAQYCIVQFYFSLGVIYRKYSGYSSGWLNKKCKWGILLVNSILFFCFKSKGYVMDLVSTSVNSPYIDMLIAINGIIWLVCISKIVDSIKCISIKKILSYIGENTLGILLYHFVGFKLVTLVFFVMNKCDIHSISLLCPPSDLSDDWWEVYVLVAICFSLFVWRVTCKLKIINFMSGNMPFLYKKIPLFFDKISSSD